MVRAGKSQPRIAALVPMRHNSERVPGKNYRPLAGKPLFYHIINKLQNCSLISVIAVDTDSAVISEAIKKDFPGVLLIERPPSLCGDDIAMNKVLLHDISMIEADFYMQTHSTNPLLQVATIQAALKTFIANKKEYDSLFSVTRLQTRLWDPKTRALNHNPDQLLRTQDLPPVFEENSCIYIFSKESLLKNQNRIGKKPFMFEIERLQALDIDEELDFVIADFLLQRYFQIPN